MRPATLALAAAVLLALSAMHLAPMAEARTLACAAAKNPSCPGIVCVDTDFDGRITYADACLGTMCPTWGCCPYWAPCPPPQDELP